MDLAMAAYDISDVFPRREIFGLTQQLRRAALSVPCNIAEGNGRGYRADYARFVCTSRGSLREVDTLVEFARRRSYLTNAQFADFAELMDHVGRMLTKLLRQLTKPPEH
jgi:four helix bundle protein